MSEWKTAGLRGTGGSELPETPDLVASLIEPDRKSRRTFLVYPNYQVILKWNRSDFFALAVGTLADQIAQAQGAKQNPGVRIQETGDGIQETGARSKEGQVGSKQ